MLRVETLSYHINDQSILSSVSLQANAGTVLSIQGPNGAGKSTLLKVLAGLIRPTTGAVFYQGLDLQRHRTECQAQLAYLGHKRAVKARLSVAEQLHNVKLNIIQNIGLSTHLDKMGDELSAGQQQRLSLARIVSQDRRIWLLDEPFTALDVAAIAQCAHFIEQHCQKGGLVVLSSHQPLTLTQTPVLTHHLTVKESA